MNDTLKAASADAGEAVTDEDVWKQMDQEGTATEDTIEAGAVAPAEVDETDAVADKTEDQGAQEKTTQQADDANTSPSGEEEVDIWAGVPEAVRKMFDEQKEKADRLEHRIKADDGRVAAYQRQVRELTEGPADKAGQEAQAKAVEKVQKEYPEIAKPLMDEMGRNGGEVANLRSEIEAMRIERYDANYQAIVEQHPDFQDVVAKNGELFAGWVQDQPLSIREAVARNDQNFVDPKSAIEVTALFKEHLGSLGLYEPSSPPAEAQTVDDKTKAKRAKQLEGASAPRTAAAPPRKAGVPQNGSWEDTWKAFDAEEKRTST